MTDKNTAIAMAAREAIKGALASRGPSKGMLKARCPDSRSDAAAAWQAIVSNTNPYKVSVGMILFFSPTQKAIFEYIEVFYNRERIHSALGFMSPEQFEAA